MLRLEEITKGVRLRGLVHGFATEVDSAEWIGGDSLEVRYRAPDNSLQERILYRSDELALEVDGGAAPWSFDANGERLKLVSEALRIQLAHLFDPYLAVHTSSIDPLPHQITAVYGEMLPRQPLRFLLADDPGAGKTIMAGLLIKELKYRGDLERCLIVSPGGLVEQWQDELQDRFDLRFEIITRAGLEAVPQGRDPFAENPLLICRLDMLSRDPALQEKLENSVDWDLVVVDEAHKMSASRFGNEVKETKRHKLGKLLGRRTRHLLLMTATPHNGKEEDFQLFMALLDGDRFEGRDRDGPHQSDASDLFCRRVKEELVTFDETPLFPERRAYSVLYNLSPQELALYEAVSDYVRNEMNRAERNAPDDKKRRVNVGFALMILQRRLASSPLAIFNSVKRRRSRLEEKLVQVQTAQKGRAAMDLLSQDLPDMKADDLEEYFDDYEDKPESEREQEEDLFLDRATAAASIEELKIEIELLEDLEKQAELVYLAGKDTKWSKLLEMLDEPQMIDANGIRRKLIIFTEPKDTVDYLTQKIRNFLGKDEAVVVIHGAVSREARRNAVEQFVNNKDVVVMVANDAACEGVNLQRGHLMVNYDLPWNPNKLEQRFGRIHRIGQTEVCHVWNLVAHETREGQVFNRLFEKLEAERTALGGKVYDVLGQIFEGHSLRDLLLEAVRYNADEDVRANLFKKIEGAVDHDRLKALVESRALAHETMDPKRLQNLRLEMERADAKRLQPHLIRAFFEQAFKLNGGQLRPREEGRFEIPQVPSKVISRARQLPGVALSPKYERICFDKAHRGSHPYAQFVAPGHPLLDATLDVTLEQFRHLLKQGAMLIDEEDPSEAPRVLVYLEHSICDGRQVRDKAQVVSRKLVFAELTEDGIAANGGAAPYLDYRAASEEEALGLESARSAAWISPELEKRAMRYAVEKLVPEHLEEVRAHHLPLIDKTEREVKKRLTREIRHWDNRAEQLRHKEDAGERQRMNRQRAEARVLDLTSRMEQRTLELELRRQISAARPHVLGACLVIPAGLLAKQGLIENKHIIDIGARKKIELLAMQAVFEYEKSLGNSCTDVSAAKCGYDIESQTPKGIPRFIEVKGRQRAANEVTVTTNELLCALNKPERFILAVVRIAEDGVSSIHYITGHALQKLQGNHVPEHYASHPFRLEALLEIGEAVQ